MLKLYGGALSRAAIVQLYLEELGVPYEFITLDMPAGEHLQPEYLAINPMGKVPAIVDGDFKLWESGAILLYLAEKYDQMPNSAEKRAEIFQWVVFSNSTLLRGLLTEEMRAKEMPQLLTPLNRTLSQQPFLLGDEFTVADLAVGTGLLYVGMTVKLDWSSDYPAIAAYTQSIASRPAFRKVMAGRG